MTNSTQQSPNTPTSSNVDAQATPTTLHPTAEQVKRFVARVRAWFTPIGSGLYSSELKSQITALAACLDAVENGLIDFDGTDVALIALEKLVRDLLNAVDELDTQLASRSKRMTRREDDDYLPIRDDAEALLEAFPGQAPTHEDRVAAGSRLRKTI